MWGGRGGRGGRGACACGGGGGWVGGGGGEGEKFPVIALDYQHRRSASALFVRLYSKC